MAKRKNDSLDFTHPGTRKRPAAAAPRRKPVPVSAGKKKPKRGRAGLIIFVASAIAVAAVWTTSDRDAKDTPTAKQPTAKSAPEPQPRATAPKAAQPYPPPTKLHTPDAPPPPKGVQVGTLPPEFLTIVQTYNTKAGFKAIALALDGDGKWAYGSISGAAAQKTANDDALAECARFGLQSGAKSDCKLFAIGDKVVW